MTPQPFREEMTGGRQLRLFETGSADQAGPAPDEPADSSRATDPTASRTESHP